MLSEQISRKIAAIKEENSLSGLLNQLSEGLLPGVHLDHLHPVHNLVHQPDPSVRLASGSHPELSKLLAHPGLEGDCHHQQHNSLVKAVKLVKKCGFDETYHKRARTNPLVEKDSDNDKLQRSTPEVVVEEDRKVKPRQRTLTTILLAKITCSHHWRAD